MERCGRIEDKDYGAFLKIMNEYLPGNPEDKINRMYDKYREAFVGYYIQDELIGICYGWPRMEDAQGEDSFTLNGIAIIHPYHASGRGAKLIAYFEEQVMKLGFDKVSVGSADGYVEKFYQQNGYLPIVYKVLREYGEPYVHPINCYRDYLELDKEKILNEVQGCDGFVILEKRIKVSAMYDGIIFDMDGTLWDTTPEVAEAFNIVLRKSYPEVTEVVTPQMLRDLFGLPLEEIGIKLFKSVPEERAKEIIKVCCDYEIEYLLEKGTTIFDGAEETIRQLSKSHPVFIVSNCQAGYIECFLELYPVFKSYVRDFECPGNSGKLKAENIRLIMERNHLKNPVYVGDTQGDANSSRKAGVDFIYARYGFGQVEEYSKAIDNLEELLEIDL